MTDGWMHTKKRGDNYTLLSGGLILKEIIYETKCSTYQTEHMYALFHMMSL